MNASRQSRPGFYSEELCSLHDFADLTASSVQPSEFPNAADTLKNVPIYDMDARRDDLAAGERRALLMAEWARILGQGPGVFVLKKAFGNARAIDDATAVYDMIIAREKNANAGGADHFAASGSNDRIWNSLQKLCEHAPETFIDYFANPAIDAACEAWLGPNYQMTAQINLVHPGGKAQQAHRDYHLGFQTAEVSATYPAHVHDLSPLMTLQGGIAHCDIPIESGPTKLLPFSQLYRPGYVAWRREDFRAYFEENHVQLPLEKGDAIFFSPALLHAAGENYSRDVHRMVNLLQISSAFGRTMETIDRAKMCKLIFGPLSKSWKEGRLTESELDAVIASAAEGYSFPTNLDRDPPTDGLAPLTQQAFLKDAVMTSRESQEVSAELEAMSRRREA